MTSPCFVSPLGQPLSKSPTPLSKCARQSTVRFYRSPVRISMVTADDEAAKPPKPSTTPTAAASETAKPPSAAGAAESDSRSKIEPDENPTYFFGEESLVEPIFKDQVPGKIQLTEEQLAEQKRNLEEYAELLRKDRLRTEREAGRLFGWVRYAETMNGRFAMFFFVTGLLTEYWTDYTIPEQVELLLRTMGVI